jgi:hypothetical protein
VVSRLKGERVPIHEAVLFLPREGSSLQRRRTVCSSEVRQLRGRQVSSCTLAIRRHDLFSFPMSSHKGFGVLSKEKGNGKTENNPA